MPGEDEEAVLNVAQHPRPESAVRYTSLYSFGLARLLPDFPLLVLCIGRTGPHLPGHSCQRTCQVDMEMMGLGASMQMPFALVAAADAAVRPRAMPKPWHMCSVQYCSEAHDVAAPPFPVLPEICVHHLPPGSVLVCSPYCRSLWPIAAKLQVRD